MCRLLLSILLFHSAHSVFSQCDADFSIINSSGCSPLEVTFVDNSIGLVKYWDFGDGTLDTTSTEDTVIHVYTQPGVYDVSLIAFDSPGFSCSDTMNIHGGVTVHPPMAAFDAIPTLSCTTPHTVFFTDQSALPDTWFWDFGDGNTSTAQNPIHTYTAYGDFQVLLTVTDTVTGCTDMAMTEVQVVFDSVPPEFLSYPPSMSVRKDSSCQFYIPDLVSMVVVDDVCDPTPSIWQSVAPGTVITSSQVVRVYAQDNLGYRDSCEVFVQLDYSPEFEYSVDTLCAGMSANVIFNGTGSGYYSCTPSGLLSDSLTSQVTAQAGDSTMYVIEFVPQDLAEVCPNQALDTIYVMPPPDSTVEALWHAGTLISNHSGADSYQWVDCLDGYLPIAGETDQTYYLPSSNGSVAVVITDYGCYSISECYPWFIGLEERNSLSDLRVFPNPASGHVNVDWDNVLSTPADLRINSAEGKLVKQLIVPAGVEAVSISLEGLSPQIYIVELEHGQGISRERLIVR